MQVTLQSLLAPLLLLTQLVLDIGSVSLAGSGIAGHDSVAQITSFRHLRHRHREPKKDEECHHLIFCNTYASDREVSVFYAPYFGRHEGDFKEKLVEKVPYGECKMSVTMHETKMQVNNFDRGSLWFEDENADQPKVPGNLKLAFAKYDIGHEPEPHWIVVFLVRQRVLDFRAKVMVQHVPKRVTKDYVPLLFRNSYHGIAEHTLMVRNKNKAEIPLKHTAFAMPPGDGDSWEAYEGTERVVQKFPADEGDMIIIMLIGNEPPQQNYEAHYFPFNLVGWSLKQGMLTEDHWSSRCKDVDCGGHGDCDPNTGKCICDAGWEGKHCESEITTPAPGAPAPPPPTTTAPPTPPPFCVDGDDTCGEHGTCVDGECVCDDGWTGQYCDIAIHPPANTTKEDMPFPALEPVTPEAVEPNSSTPQLPFEEPPAPMEPQEDEYVPLPFPDFGDDVEEQNATSNPWAPVPYNATEDSIERMEIRECAQECKPHGYCGPGGKCICDPGYTGPTCDEKLEPAVLEPPPLPEEVSRCKGNTCSGHGICRESDGLCDCDPGWTGPDCSNREMEPMEERIADGPITEDWVEEEKAIRTATSHEKPASEDSFELMFPWWLLVLLLLLCCCCIMGAAARNSESAS